MIMKLGFNVATIAQYFSTVSLQEIFMIMKLGFNR